MISGRKPELSVDRREVSFEVEGVTLEGSLAIPEGAGWVVLFAQGSGSSCHSLRNRYDTTVAAHRKLFSAILCVSLRLCGSQPRRQLNVHRSFPRREPWQARILAGTALERSEMLMGRNAILLKQFEGKPSAELPATGLLDEPPGS